MAMRSFTTIKTENASKYMQQLAKHWSHKFETLTFDTKVAYIPFRENIILNMRAEGNDLFAEITSPSEEDALRMEDVFDKHIVRFAFREELEIIWHREENI